MGCGSNRGGLELVDRVSERGKTHSGAKLKIGNVVMGFLIGRQERWPKAVVLGTNYQIPGRRICKSLV